MSPPRSLAVMFADQISHFGQISVATLNAKHAAFANVFSAKSVAMRRFPVTAPVVRGNQCWLSFGHPPADMHTRQHRER